MQEPTEGVTPVDSNPLRLSKIKKTAAGIPAAISSLNHGIRKMGVVKTVKTLLMVNQKEGFDCPGCAWPDPEHRTSFEFCENGAKAISEEYTKYKADPAFFSKNSVSSMLDWSDFELGKSGRITSPMFYNAQDDKYEEISWNGAFKLISSKWYTAPQNLL